MRLCRAYTKRHGRNHDLEFYVWSFLCWNTFQKHLK